MLNWFSFNIEDFKNFTTIICHLLKHFILYVLIDYIANIRFHGLKKVTRFINVNVRDLKVTISKLRLFSLEKTLLIFRNLSKLMKA